MEVISFVQSKGGQAKTSTCFEWAYGLNQLGKSVLCIDMDSQGNLSILANANLNQGIFNVLHEKADINELIQDFKYGKILTSNDEMSFFDFVVGSGNEKDSFFLLTDALEKLKVKPDYVLIDCPPNLGLSTLNALTASDTVIIPTTADELSIYGIGNLSRTLETVRKINPDLKIEGILITRWRSRINLNQDMEQGLKEIAQRLGTKVFKTKVRENSKLREAQFVRQSVQEFNKKAIAAIDYSEAFTEFMENRK